jgi:dolichol-phosphate mannosyltransferase
LTSADGSRAARPELVRLSVVAPCYNEEAGLDELHRRVAAACAGVAPGAYEIVLVDDGSRDATWERMQALASRDPGVVAVRLSRNHGHQLALTAGLTICRGERVLIVDADLQDPPELLPEMMRVMDGGADVVYGQREARRGESAFKRATAGAFYRVLERLSDVPIPRDTGDFRLVSRRALDVLLAMPEQHRFVRGMVSWIGFRQVPLRYVRDPRLTGETKYPLRRMVRFAADAITSFSVRPLRISAYAGALCAAGSLLLFGYTVVSWTGDRTVRGWASLMSVVLLLGAVQLLVLGMIGEYLGRLFLEAKRRPLFVVDQVVRSGESATTSPHEPRVAIAGSAGRTSERSPRQ